LSSADEQNNSQFLNDRLPPSFSSALPRPLEPGKTPAYLGHQKLEMKVRPFIQKGTSTSQNKLSHLTTFQLLHFNYRKQACGLSANGGAASEARARSRAADGASPRRNSPRNRKKQANSAVQFGQGSTRTRPYARTRGLGKAAK
jgi:hypothetical protein